MKSDEILIESAKATTNLELAAAYLAAASVNLNRLQCPKSSARAEYLQSQTVALQNGSQKELDGS